MLRQEVNLYKAMATPVTAATMLSWQRFCWSNLGFISLFVVIYLYSLFDVYYLKIQKYNLTNTNASREQKFTAVKNQYPSLFFSQDVAQSVSQLENDLAGQEKLLESISKHASFSSFLTALSTLIVPNVWLTEISIQKNGDAINLKGESLNIESIQQFLNNILHEKLFEGYGLNVENITNTSKENVNSNLKFEIDVTKKFL